MPPIRTPDEQKVIAASRDAFNKRAAFFEEAGTRHPTLSAHFNQLAEATRDMGKTVYLAEKDLDPQVVQNVKDKYPPALAALMNAATKNPAVLKELQESQQVLVRALGDFEKQHPELVPVRKALQKKVEQGL